MTSTHIGKLIKLIEKGKIKLDVCNIASNIINSSHKTKSGSSDSEIIFADLISKVKNWSFPVSLKVFLDTNTVIPSYKRDIEGIKYEVRVYKNIINPILAHNYSPNFIGFLGYGECNFETKVVSNSIKYKLREKALSYGAKEEGKLGILITNKAGGKYPVTSLAHIIRHISKIDYIKILFQILYSLAVMEVFRLVHNDLHYSNILVTELPNPVTYIYIYKEKIFKITTKYIAYLFDWDLAYSDLLGPNPKIVDFDCKTYNVCNRYSSKFDLYVLLCYLGTKISEGYDSQLVKDVSSNYILKVSKKDIERLKRLKPYVNNIYKMGHKQLSDTFENTTLHKILDRYSGIASLMFEIHDDTHIKIYSGAHCRPSSFSSNMATPKEYLNSKTFNQFRIHEKYLTNVLSRNVYRFPKKGVRPKVYMDPYGPKTRYKIVGKPRFEKQSYGSKYIKTKNNIDK